MNEKKTVSIVDLEPSGKVYLVPANSFESVNETRLYLPRYLVVQGTYSDGTNLNSDILDSSNDLEELRRKYPSSKVVRAAIDSEGPKETDY